jgi:O-antigen/teichoic acid export membrane protein
MVFASTTFSLFSAFIKASLDTVFATFLQDVLLRILILIFLVFYFFDIISFPHFMLGFVSAYLLNMLILLAYSLSQKYYLPSTSNAYSPFDLKETFTYSFFAFFSGFTMILVSNIDLIMVDMFEGLENAGIYALAMYMGTVITVPRKSLAKIIHPILTKSFNENNLAEIKRLYTQSSINQLLFSLIIYVGILTSLDDLYRLLPNEFSEGKPIIAILGLAYLFDLATGSNGQIIITSKYFRFDFISSLILMIGAVLLNYFLIPKYGLMGAAIATATSVGLYNLIKTIFVWFVLRIQPFKWHTLSIIVLGIVCFYLGELINIGGHPILSITIRFAIIGTTYLGIAYTFRLSDEFNTTIEELVVKLKSKN